MDEKAYFNDLLVRFEEIFYHELSECSRPKVELIGTDFLKSKDVKGRTVEQVVESCIKEIKAAGLVKDISYSIHGSEIMLKLNVKSCVHIPKEAKLKAGGIEPYLCPIANMILDQIIEKLNYLTTYTAEMDIDEKKGECIIKCAIFENVDKIGVVSDWTNL